MIRIALFAIGFIAITLTLVFLQPGASRNIADLDSLRPDAVTRDDPSMTRTMEDVSAEETNLTEALSAPVSAPEASETAAIVRAAPEAVGSDDLRRLTWDTLANLNAATGRNSAPGQPGSLLHSIVKRSLESVPEPTLTNALPESYVVQEGDTLVSIAAAFYGDVNMTGPLFAANQSILARPDDLRSGQILLLPKP